MFYYIYTQIQSVDSLVSNHSCRNTWKMLTYHNKIKLYQSEPANRQYSCVSYSPKPYTSYQQQQIKQLNSGLIDEREEYYKNQIKKRQSNLQDLLFYKNKHNQYNQRLYQQELNKEQEGKDKIIEHKAKLQKQEDELIYSLNQMDKEKASGKIQLAKKDLMRNITLLRGDIQDANEDLKQFDSQLSRIRKQRDYVKQYLDELAICQQQNYRQLKNLLRTVRFDLHYKFIK